MPHASAPAAAWPSQPSTGRQEATRPLKTSQGPAGTHCQLAICTASVPNPKPQLTSSIGRAALHAAGAGAGAASGAATRRAQSRNNTQQPAPRTCGADPNERSCTNRVLCALQISPSLTLPTHVPPPTHTPPSSPSPPLSAPPYGVTTVMTCVVVAPTRALNPAHPIVGLQPYRPRPERCIQAMVSADSASKT